MSEYRDAISPGQIELAVERALDLCRTAPGLPLDDHVRKAVAETISACVGGLTDDLERHLSDRHGEMLYHVRRRAALSLGDVQRAKADPVDEASQESFPASDPPAWIWEHADSREQEE